MRNADDLLAEDVPTGGDLALLTGCPITHAEAYLYLLMLHGLSDDRFPREQLNRYVGSRYGLAKTEFQSAMLRVERAALAASDAWSRTALEDVVSVFQHRGVELDDSSRVRFEWPVFVADLQLELAVPIADRRFLLRAASALRDALFVLAGESEDRAVGARFFRLRIFDRDDDPKIRLVLRGEVAARTAVMSHDAEPLGWLDQTGVTPGPLVADLLVNLLPAKLAALRLANGGLQGIQSGLGLLRRLLRNRQ